MLAKKFTEEEIEDFKEVFGHFDKDNNGNITVAKLKTVIHSLGQNHTEEEIRGLIKETTGNNKEEINFEEFLKLMSITLNDSLDELKEAFSIFDKNGNGSISIEEVRCVMASLEENISEEELNSMIQQVDTNGDGLIDFEDFVQVMMSK